MDAAPTPEFADWYRAAHPGLLESVLRAVPRPGLAEEAVDAAFEKAFARWARVSVMASPGGWVHRVAVNEARRQLGREVREADRLAAFSRERPAAAPPPAGEAWLDVADLPARQRAAVVLRHVGGLTEAEVAAAMGVTRSTVSRTLDAAHRRLAGRLADPDPTTTPAPRRTPMDLVLATAADCHPDGCTATPLDGGPPVAARWSDAVRDTIKVRPGDLVALDGATVVWRWWSGTVVSAPDGGSPVVVERNVTQRQPGDPHRMQREVGVSEDLRGTLAAGDVVWFGPDGDDLVVVATRGPEAVRRLAPALPRVVAALS